ncbi:MAG: OLD family endonuclease [Chloroflexi bacterium HGW-Chloroflexi-10]|nr:MAG: OLD family endonuclease [Chloroflexi bacterium HGW-Chloroflexi-10]
MKLVSLTLKNFRCYKDEKTLQFNDLTTLIGKNDIGKSSVLEALEIFFNNAVVKIDCGDCSILSDNQTVEITCEFTHLPAQLVLDAQAETTLADEYLLCANNNLRIKKTYKCIGSKPKEDVFVIANHPSTDQYNDLLELTNPALKKRLKDLKISEEGVQLNNNPSIRRAIWQSCLNLNLRETDIPVSKEDGKRIWENIGKHLPLFALFQSDRASRDSDAEVQDPMKLAIATALAEPDIQTRLSEIVEAVKTKAVELAERTHTALTKIDPDLAQELTPEFKAEPKWSGLFSLALNSDQGIPVNKRGSGIRRLILVSFFRAEAERRLAEKQVNNIIYAIEEPETSQHPNNQKILLESFQDLAAESGCQVLLTTHSPGFASYLPTSSFRFIKKGADTQPVIENATEATWKEIAKTLGVIPDNRVRVLICVEGPTDVSAMQYLSNALHDVNPEIPDLLNDPRIAFVVLGGGTLKHWVNQHYLRGLGRPEVHIYDNDVAKYADAINEVNLRQDGSWGVQTQKFEIENYLHPDAILDGLSYNIPINDTDDIPALFKAAANWNPNNAKKKLAQYAFPKMTAARIAQRDPNCEVEGWFIRIGAML